MDSELSSDIAAIYNAAAAYNAGPNAVVYYLAENEERVAGTFKNILGDKTGWEGKNVKSEVQVPEGNEVAAARLAVYSQVEESEFFDSPFHL